MNLLAAVERNVPNMKSVALRTPEGQNLTYEEILHIAGRFASLMARCGVLPGDRVAVQVEKSVEALLLYLGCLGAGAIYLPLNPAYTPLEVEYFVNDAEPRLGCAHSSRATLAGPRKSGPAVLRCAAGHEWLRRRIAPASAIAIEAAMGAGSRTQRRIDMATIGTFKKTGNEYTGEIVTLSVQAKNVRIAPEEGATNGNAPSHRVFVGRAEIGAAWSKTSNEGRDYLSLKLDDPSFTRLYAAFGSKAGLYREAFDLYEGLPGALDGMEDAKTLEQALAGLLNAAIRVATTEERGCMISTGLVEGAVEQQELMHELGERRRALRSHIADALCQWLDRSEAERLAAYLSAVQQGMSVQARDGAPAQELSRIADEAVAGIVARRKARAS